jgi:hypothetical protein
MCVCVLSGLFECLREEVRREKKKDEYVCTAWVRLERSKCVKCLSVCECWKVSDNEVFERKQKCVCVLCDGFGQWVK